MTDRTPAWPVTALILAVSSLTVMANATISPSLPGLAAAFSDTPNIETLAGLVLSIPSLSIVLSAGLIGVLLGRVSWKPVLAVALSLYALSGASAALADTMPEILISRVGLGLGVAGTMTVATMLAAELYEGQARARFMGWQAAAMSGGGIVFLLAGGALAEIGWRMPFLIYLAALPLMLAGLVVFRPVRSGPVARPDALPGAFPWRHLAGFAALAFFVMAVFYLIPTKLPFRLQALGVTSPAQVGAAVAAMTTFALPGALGYGRLRARASPAAIFAGCFGLMTAGYLIIWLAPGYGAVVIGTALSGMGLGPMMPNVMSTTMARIPAEGRGRAAGLMTTALFAGQFASPLIGGGVAGQVGLPATYAVFAAMMGTVAAGAALRARQPAPIRAGVA